jgi:hypothetical protein
MGDDFPILDTTKHIKSDTVLSKLQEEDYEGFKKLVPKFRKMNCFWI